MLDWADTVMQLNSIIPKRTITFLIFIDNVFSFN